jgi:hypothetical protein
MNSNKRKLTEQEVEEFRTKWRQPLRMVFTKDDIAAISATIRANERQGNDIPSAAIPALNDLSASSASH